MIVTSNRFSKTFANLKTILYLCQKIEYSFMFTPIDPISYSSRNI